MNKILYVGGFELPDKNAAAHRVLGNAKVLKALGFEVILIGANKSSAELNEPKFVDGFEFFEYQYPQNASEWIQYLSSISFLKEMIKEKGAVHAVIAYNYPAIALSRMRYLGVKVFSDCTEWYLPQGSLLFRALKTFDVFLRMKYVNKKIDGVIAISDYLEKYYSPFVKTINIPPLIDKTNSKWDEIDSSDNNQEKVKFIYSGSPGNGQKDNLEKVISLVRDYEKVSNKNCKLQIVGISKEQYLIQQTTFNKWPLNDSLVEFYGRLSHIDSLNLIKKSDFFIFLRDNNLVNRAGFPTKFVEAVSLGITVISNKSSNIATYYSEYPEIGFLIDDMSVEEFCSKVNEYLKTSSRIASTKHIFNFENYISEFSNLMGRNVKIS